MNKKEESKKEVTDKEYDKELKKIKEELERIKKEKDEYLVGWKRAKADLINFQREGQKRQEEYIKYSQLEFVLKILPIWESCTLASRGKINSLDELKEGVENVAKQFTEAMRSLGVEKIKVVGEKFNPERHEAIVFEKDENKEDGLIIEEISSGYTLNNKVIKAARVKIIKN